MATTDSIFAAGPLTRAFASKNGHHHATAAVTAKDPFASVVSKLFAARDTASAERESNLVVGSRLQGSRASKQPLKLQLVNASQPSSSTSPSSQTLVRGIRQLLDFQTDPRKIGTDLNTLYRHCDQIASFSFRTGQDEPLESLYESVKMEMERSLTALTRQLKSSLPASSGNDASTLQAEQAWLAIFAESWSTWKKRTNLVSSVLLPLDRSAHWSSAATARKTVDGDVQMQDVHEKRLETSALAVDSFAHQVMQDVSLKDCILPFTTRALDTFCRIPQIEKVVLSAEVGDPAKGKQASLPSSADESKFRNLYVESLLTLFRETHSQESLQKALHESTATFYERVSKDKMQEAKTVAPIPTASPDKAATVQSPTKDDSTTDDGETAKKRKEEPKVPSYVSVYVTWLHSAIEHERTLNLWLYENEFAAGKAVALVLDKAGNQHIEDIISGFPLALDNVDLSALTSLYSIAKEATFANIGATKTSDKIKTFLGRLRTAFADYVRAKVGGIVTEKTRDDEMIPRLLELKSGVDLVTAEAFRGDDDFGASLRDSFEKGINQRENKPPELVAKHLDLLLKSGNKTMTDAQLEKSLNDALVLFRFTKDKDMFEEFYARHFARRLLLNKSASSDAEMSMLLKLKEECGPDFTRKLETMLKDITLSDDIMKSWQTFEAKSRTNGELAYSFDLSVNVLTQAHWPTYPQMELILPKDLENAAETFKVFYQGRNSGRRLYWQHSLGSNTITADMGKAGLKEFHVSTPQAVVLLLFNNVAPGEAIPYRDILTQTGMEARELKRTLQSLACGQIPTRVLRKNPQGKDVNDDDMFIVNENLKNDRPRIRINQIQERQTAEEQKETEQHVLLERDLVLQAAAVRVLKAKKTIKHGDLVNEVIEQIKGRFAIESSELKKVFESLIERDYMERVEGQRGMYRYIA